MNFKPHPDLLRRIVTSGLPVEICREVSPNKWHLTANTIRFEITDSTLHLIFSADYLHLMTLDIPVSLPLGETLTLSGPEFTVTLPFTMESP